MKKYGIFVHPGKELTTPRVYEYFFGLTTPRR
jgi:hypothetical protein